MWAPLAVKTESFARTPSIATSGQDHLPVSGQDLPRRVKHQGQGPMEQPRATSWAAAEMFEAAKPHPDDNSGSYRVLLNTNRSHKRLRDSSTSLAVFQAPALCRTADVRSGRCG